MRAVIQRVLHTDVKIDGAEYSSIDKGLLILLGIKVGDTKADADYVASKCMGLRIFEDENGKLNLSSGDIGGEFMVVSNFTLYGDTSHGKRPSFIDAERPEKAEPIYEYFADLIKNAGFSVKTGKFGADMKINILNDGPITIIIDSETAKQKEK